MKYSVSMVSKVFCSVFLLNILYNAEQFLLQIKSIINIKWLFQYFFKKLLFFYFYFIRIIFFDRKFSTGKVLFSSYEKGQCIVENGLKGGLFVVAMAEAWKRGVLKSHFWFPKHNYSPLYPPLLPTKREKSDWLSSCTDSPTKLLGTFKAILQGSMMLKFYCFILHIKAHVFLSEVSWNIYQLPDKLSPVLFILLTQLFPFMI